MKTVNELRQKAKKITNMIGNIVLFDGQSEKIIEGYLHSVFIDIQNEFKKNENENENETIKYKRIKVDKVCDLCKKEFIGQKQSKYCSEKCSHNAFLMRIAMKKDMEKFLFIGTIKEYDEKYGHIYRDRYKNRGPRKKRIEKKTVKLTTVYKKDEIPNSIFGHLMNK